MTASVPRQVMDPISPQRRGRAGGTKGILERGEREVRGLGGKKWSDEGPRIVKIRRD